MSQIQASKWTPQDESRLQNALAEAEFWRRSLENSINATSLREGGRARAERAYLIASADRRIRKMQQLRDACFGGQQ